MSDAFTKMIDSIVTGADAVPETVKKAKGTVIRDGRKPAAKAKKAAKVEAPVVEIPAEELEVMYEAIKTVNKELKAPADELVEVVVKPAAKEEKGESKASIALSIVRSFDGSRKECIAAIMERCGMSTAGATTYYYNAKKALAKAA